MADTSKILHLYSADGAWEPMIHIAGLAAALREHGFSSAVAAPEHSRLWELAEGAGVEVIDYALERSLNPFRWRDLGTLIRDSGAGLVHTHDSGAAGQAARARLFSPSVAVVTSRYDLDSPPSAPEFGGEVQTILCPSEKVAAAFRERKAPEAKIRVAAAGANLAMADRSSEERDIIRPAFRTLCCPEKEKPLFLVNIAPLEPASGCTSLIEIFPEILAALPQSHLVLMGEGSLRPELERQVRITALEKDVTILEPDKAFHRLLAAADLYLSPSLADESGLMLQAAMAAGRACVLSEAGCHGEFAQDGKNAVFFPPGDTEALKGKVLDLLRNRAQREHYGRQARARAAKAFALPLQAEKTAAVYREALAVG